MSYAHAPATALVATACCVCGRELLEAESIASGIGPVCAEKTGFHRAELGPEIRAEVNQLVYELAALQRSIEAVPRIARLRALGLAGVADRVQIRVASLAEVSIDVAGDAEELLVVKFPFLTDQVVFKGLLRDLRQIPGYQLTALPKALGKSNVVPNNRGAVHGLYRALSRVFAGRVTRSPKGIFLMPTEAEVDAAFNPRPGRRGAR